MFNHNFGTQWFLDHWFETYNGTIGSKNKFQLPIQFIRKEISNILANIFYMVTFIHVSQKMNYTKE